MLHINCILRTIEIPLKYEQPLLRGKYANTVCISLVPYHWLFFFFLPLWSYHTVCGILVP